MVIDEEYYFGYESHNNPASDYENFYRILKKEYDSLTIEQKKKARTEGRDGLNKEGETIFMSISGRLPNNATRPGYRGKYFDSALGVDPQLMPETYEYLVKNVGAEY